MLEKLGKNTYVINGQNKTFIYLFNKDEVVIIDTGINDKSGQNILDICKEHNFKIKMVINTHSHSDHIGGNNIIKEELDVPIYAPMGEDVLIENPEILAAISYGGYPHKYLRRLYNTKEKTEVKKLTKKILPKGLELIDLPGHNDNMIGFKTSDDIYFLSDAVAGEDVITKYQLQFIYNIKEYFKTLKFIKNLEGKLFVPSHGKSFTDVKKIVSLNEEAAFRVIGHLKNICKKPKSYESILQEIFDIYQIKMDFIQNSFIGLTIKCYLSYMLDQKLLDIKFVNNVMLWVTL